MDKIEDPTALLQRAAETGDLHAAQRALATEGVRVDAFDDHGLTALSHAALSGYLPLVDALLAARCDFDKLYEHSWTPLGMAVAVGHTHVAQRLIAAGANVDAINAYHDSALMCAVRHGQLETFDALLDAKVDVNVVNVRGESVLTVACRENLPGIVKKLLLAGANALHLDSDGDSPLCVAAVAGHEDVVAILLEAMDDDDQDSNTAQHLARTLNHAATHGYYRIAQRLIDAGANPSDPGILASAVESGCAAVVRVLLDAGADPTESNGCGDTALIHASRARSPDIVEMLRSLEGVTLEHSNDRGNTALLCAVDSTCLDVVWLLVAAGANVHHVNKEGETALIRACSHGEIETTEMLLSFGVDVDAITRDGWTALFFAVHSRSVPVVEKLLATGRVDVNYVASFGDSALVLAARTNQAHMAQVLLAHGADADHSGEDNWTALMVASANGYVDVVTSLLEAGADVRMTNSEGLSALLLAVAGDHVRVVELLCASSTANVYATNDDGHSAVELARCNCMNFKVLDWLRSRGMMPPSEAPLTDKVDPVVRYWGPLASSSPTAPEPRGAWDLQ